jgi:DNA-binding transcriptional ArsR family regulator
MVKLEQLDNTFHALADSTRRHIVGMLVEQKEHRIKELVEPFEMSFVAVSKHIKVLEKAGLVKRTRRGREHFIELNTAPLIDAQNWIGFYRDFWTERFSNLDKLLGKIDIENK